MTRRVTLKLDVTFIDKEDTGLIPMKAIADLVIAKMREPGLRDDILRFGPVMSVHDLFGRADTKATLITTTEITNSFEQ